MATDRVTIEQIIQANRITLISEMVNQNPHMDGSDNMDNYKCVLMIVRESSKVLARMTLHFSKGIGHHGAEPEAAEVLSCLASDAAGVENSQGFDDWCSEYGYGTDSRKAEKVYKACKHQAARLKTFLGNELFDQLLWHTEQL